MQTEKQRMELERGLDELSQRLDDAGGATHAQVSSTYKRCNFRSANIEYLIKTTEYIRSWWKLELHRM